MQSLSSFKHWIAAAAGAGLIGNGGYVLNAALSMDSSNLFVLVQAVLCFIAGLGGVGYAAKNSKPVSKPAFQDDMAAVQHLAVNCKGCKKSEDALGVLTEQITKGLFK